MKNKLNRILVIEDNKPLLNAITEMLEKEGFNVITARSVEQAFNARIDKFTKNNVISLKAVESAIEYFKELEEVGAIWLDHSLLGKEDGLDFVKKFKANGGKWKKIPVFVVSNTENAEIVKSYMDIGVSKYYIKSNHKLFDIIRDIKTHLAQPIKKSTKTTK